MNLIHSKKSELHCELVGSWTVEVGDLDQALHLWQCTGGFERVDRAQLFFSQDAVKKTNFKPHFIFFFYLKSKLIRIRIKNLLRFN